MAAVALPLKSQVRLMERASWSWKVRSRERESEYEPPTDWELFSVRVLPKPRVSVLEPFIL